MSNLTRSRATRFHELLKLDVVTAAVAAPNASAAVTIGLAILVRVALGAELSVLVRTSPPRVLVVHVVEVEREKPTAHDCLVRCLGVQHAWYLVQRVDGDIVTVVRRVDDLEISLDLRVAEGVEPIAAEVKPTVPGSPGNQTVHATGHAKADDPIIVLGDLLKQRVALGRILRADSGVENIGVDRRRAMNSVEVVADEVAQAAHAGLVDQVPEGRCLLAGAKVVENQLAIARERRRLANCNHEIVAGHGVLASGLEVLCCFGGTGLLDLGGTGLLDDVGKTHDEVAVVVVACKGAA
jgi:hypothetical protein